MQESTTGREIERKFIVVNDAWKKLVDPDHIYHIEQGYLRTENGTVRVRISTPTRKLNGDWVRDDAKAKATVTHKMPGTGKVMIDRPEWNAQVPVAMARSMLDHSCYSRIEKRRYYINWGDAEYQKWTVDKFLPKSDYHHFKMAEVEFPDPAHTALKRHELPPFICTEKVEKRDLHYIGEVTLDGRFSNKFIASADSKEYLHDMLEAARKAVKDARART